MLAERGCNMQKEYIENIAKLLNECNDLELLDFILQLLNASSDTQ